MSQQPYKTKKVDYKDSVTKKAIINKKTNRPIQTNEYYYKNNQGKTVVIQDHHKGHKYNQNGKGDQDEHFNVRPPENLETGKVPGTQEHYPYKKRSK